MHYFCILKPSPKYRREGWWGWRAFEQRGGGVWIVRTAGEDSPPDFNHRLPPSQTTARGRRAGFGFGSFALRGKIRLGLSREVRGRAPRPRSSGNLFGECRHVAHQKRVGGASPLEGYSWVKNGECGKQRGAIPTIRRWRRGGGGRCEHPRPMDGCRRGGARGAEERAH